MDDTFSFDEIRVLEICGLIDSRKMDLKWKCIKRGDILSEETARVMAKAGLVSVNIGVESGSTRMLEAMGKDLDLSRLRENISMLRRLGVSVSTNYIFGYPGESAQSIEETKGLIAELAVPYSVELFTPFPGTAARQMLEMQGRMSNPT
ncbi:MAG: radical SAM protein [Candidatus Altiarchaeota archaeon]